MRNKNKKKLRRYTNKVGGKQNIIGNKLKKLRRNAKPKVSQEDLVGRLASQNILLNRTAIAKIEAGTRAVKDFEARAIAKALKVSITALVEEQNTRTD